MDENELARRVIESKPEGVRNREKPKLRWIDEVWIKGSLGAGSHEGRSRGKPRLGQCWSKCDELILIDFVVKYTMWKLHLCCMNNCILANLSC